MFHRTQFGESPAQIARTYGVTQDALIRANPHKPTRSINGQQTWQTISHREPVRLPFGGVNGTLGDAASDAIHALISAGGPCRQENVGIVCAIQAALGLAQDGKYGNDTANAAKRIFSGAPSGCSPAPLWWGKKGENKCVGAVMPTLPALPAMPGLPVSFPSPLPAVLPSPAPLADALRTLGSGIDPCYSGNAAAICAAQAALGLTQDGKYGNDTAAALKRAIGSAPPPCSPAPAWWGKKGESKCGGAAAIPLPGGGSIPAAATPGTEVVVAPSGGGDKKGLSTGAMIAGGVGIAAVVGLAALAMSGKRTSSVSRTTITRRASAKRKPSKKRK